MERHIESLQGIAMEYEQRPVWDKLGEKDPSNQDNFDIDKYINPEKESHKSTSSSYWLTTNGEYGRFHIIRQMNAPNTDDHVPCPSAIYRSMELLGSRPVSGRDPGASARSRAESVAKEEAIRTGERADSIARATGTSLPIRRARYMTLQGSQPEQSNLEPERRKLTTGFAKKYMRTSCSGLWGNMQSVADGAGFLTSAKAGSRPDTNAEVLKVEYPTDGGDVNNFMGDFNMEDMSYNYTTEDYEKPQQDSRPASRQASGGLGSSRSRQQGYL